jgi:CBS domain-containing protein
MFRRILVGLDGSPLGQLAFQAALELACRYRAKLIALSVVEEPVTGNHQHDETESQQFYCQVQTNAYTQARAAGISLQTVMRHGHAARALVEFAEEVEANPIILGATGHERPWSLTMGGTAWRVISDTARAVMVIRPPRTVRWVRDIMVHHVSTVTPQTPLAEVVGLFLRQGAKAVPVVDGRQHVVGMITGGDLLTRADLEFRLSIQQEWGVEVVAQQLHRLEASGKTASDIMTPRPRTITADTPVLVAIRTMADHGMKRLPVVDMHGRLAGILSRADVLCAVAAGAQLSAAQEEIGPSPGASQVGDLMLTEVPTVRPGASIDKVVHVILNSPTRRVVVTSPAGLVQGIITDRQLLARAAADLRPGFIEQLADLLDTMAPWRDTHHPLTANDLMHTDVFTVQVDEPIIHAIRLLMQLQVKRLVVVDAGRHLQGIVDRRTLLRWLAQTPSRWSVDGGRPSS